MSVYEDRPAGPEVIVTQINRLAAVFTENTSLFWDLLAERIRANDFTEKRLKEAVNRLLDNFVYGKIKISDVISFDKRIRLYDYPEVCGLWRSGYAAGDFENRKIDGTVYWIKKKDLINK